MTVKDILDLRLSAWADLRHRLDLSDNPFDEIIMFWNAVPYCAHNPNIDPYNQFGWPTPWEIIAENIYDDFTKALMMGYTVLLTDKFKDCVVELRTLVDNDRKRLYNIIVVDNHWVLNFNDEHYVLLDSIPSLYRLENHITLDRPR